MSLDAIYHALDPIAFSVGPFSVRWYGIAYVLGFVLGAVVVWRLLRWRYKDIFHFRLRME